MSRDGLVSFLSQLSSGDASDSICPKGWGIAEFEGDGSYQKLFANVYGMNKTNMGINQKYKEYNVSIRFDDFPLQKLFLLPRAGSFDYGRGISVGGTKTTYGYYWLNKTYFSNYAHFFLLNGTYLSPQHNNYKGYGISVRYVAKSLIFSHFSIFLTQTGSRRA